MIKNPIHLRLEKLAHWQHRLFMVCLCERMYPNYVMYCRELNIEDDKIYKTLLDLVWESLLVKKAKINFDNQLEKLETIIPSVSEDSPYIINPAIDACQGLSELIHSFLSEDMVEHAIQVSQLSIKTVAELEMTKLEKDLSEKELEKLQPVLDELDLQWEIYRLLLAENNYNIDLIKGLREELREDQISNIGVFLSD